jgi:hypothetical protein
MNQEKYIEIQSQMFRAATPFEASLKLAKEMSLQIENEKVDTEKVPY